MIVTFLPAPTMGVRYMCHFSLLLLFVSNDGLVFLDPVRSGDKFDVLLCVDCEARAFIDSNDGAARASMVAKSRVGTLWLVIATVELGWSSSQEANGVAVIIRTFCWSGCSNYTTRSICLGIDAFCLVS